jgi:hypothetical protein
MLTVNNIFELMYQHGVEHSCVHFKSTADVVPKSEEGAECPTCHGTGRIGTTDWLTKNISKKQLAEEKAQAIAEHEQHIKSEVAREIFEEIERLTFSFGYGVRSDHTVAHTRSIDDDLFKELEKKYMGEKT